jgi:hypothetical protein
LPEPLGGLLQGLCIREGFGSEIWHASKRHRQGSGLPWGAGCTRCRRRWRRPSWRSCCAASPCCSGRT